MNSNSQANYTTDESKSHTNDDYGIDKFEGSFEKEEMGVTIVPNKSINEIRNPEALGLYVYLLARPSGWRLNIKQLSDHFQCGNDRMYRILNYLKKENFITSKVVREKGRFVKYHYRVHLGRFSPIPENPEVEEPEVDIEDTYKTKKVLNKEGIKKPIVDLSKSTGSYKADILFMAFYSLYPNKQKPSVAHKAFYTAFKKSKEFDSIEQFSLKLVEDLVERTSTVWKGRHKSKIPHPSTYLNNKEWEGEIYEAETGISKSTGSSKYSLADVMGA